METDTNRRSIGYSSFSNTLAKLYERASRPKALSFLVTFTVWFAWLLFLALFVILAIVIIGAWNRAVV